MNVNENLKIHFDTMKIENIITDETALIKPFSKMRIKLANFAGILLIVVGLILMLVEEARIVAGVLAIIGILIVVYVAMIKDRFVVIDKKSNKIYYKTKEKLKDISDLSDFKHLLLYKNGVNTALYMVFGLIKKVQIGNVNRLVLGREFELSFNDALQKWLRS